MFSFEVRVRDWLVSGLGLPVRVSYLILLVIGLAGIIIKFRKLNIFRKFNFYGKNRGVA